MEAARYSETSVIVNKLALSHIAEDCFLLQHRHKNTRSFKEMFQTRILIKLALIENQFLFQQWKKRGR
jgi:hypothetical protein